MPPYFSKDFQMTDSKVEENMIHVTETGLKKILLQEASYGGRHGPDQEDGTSIQSSWEMKCTDGIVLLFTNKLGKACVVFTFCAIP